MNGCEVTDQAFHNVYLLNSQGGALNKTGSWNENKFRCPIHRSFSKYYENTELDQGFDPDARGCGGDVLGHFSCAWFAFLRVLMKRACSHAPQTHLRGHALKDGEE